MGNMHTLEADKASLKGCGKKGGKKGEKGEKVTERKIANMHLLNNCQLGLNVS
jgi:hypothetical protein